MDQPNLPPYSGGYFECPKCKGLGARTDYVAPEEVVTHQGHVLHTIGYECLRRTCSTCGWETDEATADVKPPAWTNRETVGTRGR